MSAPLCVCGHPQGEHGALGHCRWGRRVEACPCTEYRPAQQQEEAGEEFPMMLAQSCPACDDDGDECQLCHRFFTRGPAPQRVGASVDPNDVLWSIDSPKLRDMRATIDAILAKREHAV